MSVYDKAAKAAYEASANFLGERAGLTSFDWDKIADSIKELWRKIAEAAINSHIDDGEEAYVLYGLPEDNEQP